jgi:glycosyltransferase involved in cell wall biosynthesis
MKYIYWFSYYNSDLPSVRYRANYPLRELKEKHGINYSIVYPGYDFKSVLNFCMVYFSALFFRKKNSIIVIQKLYTNGIYGVLLKFLLLFRRKNTHYDLDDAEYLEYPPAPINYFLKKCAGNSMGSAALVEYAKRFNENSFLLTSPVIAHGQIKKDKKQVFTLGWIGCYGGAHREALFESVFPAIREISFDAKLVLLGVEEKEHIEELKQYFSETRNLILEIPQKINWHNEESVYKEIAGFDIGLAPLKDIEMHRAKSAFKLKQYFSCGVPALGSSIGENGRFLENEVNGFVCNTKEDYARMILLMKQMKKKEYDLLSLNALRTARKFTVEKYCEELIGFYN